MILSAKGSKPHSVIVERPLAAAQSASVVVTLRYAEGFGGPADMNPTAARRLGAVSYHWRRPFGGSLTFAARRTNCAVVPLVWFVPPPRSINPLSRACQRIPSLLVTGCCRHAVSGSRGRGRSIVHQRGADLRRGRLSMSDPAP
jgi:hypothetical protein